jgi:predicted NUDIX family NTP pyrophosphohydrolase
MPRISAGVLLHRGSADRLQVLLVHPGGPYWAKRDLGAWSIPKGEVESGEDARAAALREFHEETGFAVEGQAWPLGQAKQPSGKIVMAWAISGDVDAGRIQSNRVAIEWPPRSGRRLEFPEVDRAEWFDLAEARRRILPGQACFLDALAGKLGAGPSDGSKAASTTADTSS